MQWLKQAGAVAAVAAGLVLAACGTVEIPTKKIDYKSTTKLPNLEIPPDLARPGSDERFAVPDSGAGKGTATFSDFNKDRASRPQAASAQAVLPNVENVRIERAGTQRWLVVPGTPEQIWPAVKEFWQQTGFVVNVETPEAGVMETDWSENRAKIPETGIRGFVGRALDSLYSTSERDKFRTRLERGAQPGTTEIYVSHRGMEEVYINEYQDQLRWQPRKPDPDLEAEMLRRMMIRLGVDGERAKTQVASAKLEPQAKLNKGGAAGSMLALNDQFDRAWRRVGLALDRVGFTVEDRDRSKGLYFVRYIDPDADIKTTEEKGWFSKLKFWGNTKIQSKEQYRILVQADGSGAEVRVLDKDGTREQSDTANRILTLLYDQLK
ncbi:MAG: outer membrane protein assembly factor BamC [Burkholderiales bacterium]|jgi:outer membrane protein assembly factor BamC|nr:outer membrane protein assembly factor BamC [Burkholderiales bacterium]